MASSSYKYVTPAALPGFIHTMSSVTDADLAAKFISDAEVIVDRYVGSAPKFYTNRSLTLSADVASGATSITTTSLGNRRTNYWAVGGVYIRISEHATASLVGQERLIVSSSGTGVTLVSGFDAVLAAATTDLEYLQKSAFPRVWDQDPWGSPQLPDELDRAVAYQVEYGIQFGSENFGMGDADVATDEDGQVQSRTYASGYSESRVPGEKRGLAAFTAPKARAILRNIINSTGHMRP